MSQTFVFEELDETTREYLIAVRNAQGEGAPGVFIPTTSTLAGCGCILGPIIIGLTLALTLTDWINVVYEDPVKVAFVQTAWILVGGWLLFAAFRTWGSKGSAKIAGHWVYADSLYLYEATREQVQVTPIDNVVEASFTHNYNNNAYQNSVITIGRSDAPPVKVTVNNEGLAEQMVVYLNYLAWARSAAGGARATFAPAVLGGLAKYVATHDSKPKDIDDNIDLNQIELDITEVPKEPTQEGRAAPNVFPYIVMLLAGVGIFYVMAYIVNPPIHDDALFAAVSKAPTEPVYLRAYLADPRNKNHRDEAQRLLNQHYTNAAGIVRNRGGDPQLSEGLAVLLESLKIPEDPVVSLKITEDGGNPGAQARVDKLRDGLVGKLVENRKDPDAKYPDWFTAQGGLLAELAAAMPPVLPPPDVVFPHPRTALGLQIIQFAAIPEDAKNAHIEVGYEFKPVNPGGKLFTLSVRVEFRTDLEKPPVQTYVEDREGHYTADQFEQAIENLQNRLLDGLIRGRNKK